MPYACMAPVIVGLPSQQAGRGVTALAAAEDPPRIRTTGGWNMHVHHKAHQQLGVTARCQPCRVPRAAMERSGVVGAQLWGDMSSGQARARGLAGVGEGCWALGAAPRPMCSRRGRRGEGQCAHACTALAVTTLIPGQGVITHGVSHGRAACMAARSGIRHGWTSSCSAQHAARRMRRRCSATCARYGEVSRAGEPAAAGALRRRGLTAADGGGDGSGAAM